MKTEKQKIYRGLTQILWLTAIVEAWIVIKQRIPMSDPAFMFMCHIVVIAVSVSAAGLAERLSRATRTKRKP